MNEKYILAPDGRSPIAEPDLLKWAEWFENHDRIVRQDHVGDYFVSTVFLGLDHNWSQNGPPILWESMIFNSGVIRTGDDIQQRRYTSYDDALAGHEAMVERVRMAVKS